jgi:hypothetical protein
MTAMIAIRATMIDNPLPQTGTDVKVVLPENDAGEGTPTEKNSGEFTDPRSHSVNRD